jgi:hypothetical protein
MGGMGYFHFAERDVMRNSALININNRYSGKGQRAALLLLFVGLCVL